jgi:hypothetical protein
MARIMKSIIFLTTLMIFGYQTMYAQDLANCKNPCRKTRIVKSGPYMGLRTLTLPDSLYVRVVEVVKNGPSVKNGILLYDTLTHFNGKVIKNMEYFIGEVAKLQPDDTITVTAVRSGIATVYKYPLGALQTKKISEIVCCDELNPKPDAITKHEPKPKTKAKREYEPVQQVGPELEPDLEPEPQTKHEPKPKRKAKRELEPVQQVGPELEPELEPEPQTKNEPKPKRKAKRELEPVQQVGPELEPELEPEPLSNNEPKPKRKAKRELEPVQPVEPDTEPALEPEPLRTAEPIQKPEPKPAPVPIPAPKPQAIPASDALQLAELEQNNLSFILSPTPAKAYLLINCYEEIKSEVTLDIQDLNGKVVLSEKVSKKNGNFEVKMDISSLPDGVYFIKIYVENTDYVQRFVKKK